MVYDCASQVLNVHGNIVGLVETDVYIGAKTYLLDNLTVELDTQTMVSPRLEVFSCNLPE